MGDVGSRGKHSGARHRDVAARALSDCRGPSPHHRRWRSFGLSRAWLLAPIGAILLTCLDWAYLVWAARYNGSITSVDGPVLATLAIGMHAIEQLAEAHEKLLVVVGTLAIAIFTATLWNATRGLQRLAAQ